MRRKILIGTRGSPLALAQAELVIRELERADAGIEPQRVVVKTLGDIMPSRKLGEIDAKSAFTSELDKKLLEGGIDAAVHSMKDVPSEIDNRLKIAATPRRGDPRDALVSGKEGGLAALGRGSRVGTSSVRRKAQLLMLRPDLSVVEIHGNVETRIGKIQGRRLSGVVLAAAGLQRLGLESKISQAFTTDEMVPAVCQGTLAVEARRDDKEMLSLLSKIDDAPTRASSACERAFAAALGGDCNVPLGAFASFSSGRLRAVGIVASPERKGAAKSTISGPAEEAKDLGERLARKVEDAGGRVILRELTA